MRRWCAVIGPYLPSPSVWRPLRKWGKTIADPRSMRNCIQLWGMHTQIRRLMWPRPIFLHHSLLFSVQYVIPLMFFYFSSLSPLSFRIYATASSPPIIPLLSFPTHTLLLLCSFFIHSYFTASTATVSHPIELELFLIIIFLVASICIPPAFLPKGISLLSLTLSPHTPPSFWLVPSRLFSCAIHSSSSPPSQFVSL